MRDHRFDLRAVIKRLVSISGMQPDNLLAALNIELESSHILLQHALDSTPDLFDLVGTCLSIEGGSRAFVNALRRLHEDSPEVDEIAKLLSPAAPFLQEDDERRIQELLLQVNVDNLAELYHVATEGVARIYPPGLTNIWEVFYYLLDSNVRPGRLAPHLRLVALVVRDLLHGHSPPVPGLAVELRRWMYQQCDGLRQSGDSDAAAELDLLLRKPPPQQTRNDFPVTLIVHIAPLPAPNDDRDLHNVSYWYQVDHVQWQPERGEDKHLPMRDVPRYVLDLVEQAEEGWGYGVRGPLLLEFILPIELINLEVDRWPLEENLSSPETLGSEYEVVVRGDPDLRPSRRDKDWHTRWETFLKGNGGVHQIPLDEPYDLTRLRDDLTGIHLVACVLSTPPDRDPGRSEIREAIKKGLPIVLWCRDSMSNKDFRTAVADAIDPPKLKKLPTAIKDLRSSRPKACGNVALFWDDPNHPVPGLHRLRTPSS
ncbi:VMAP-C domain-containing protein [Nonomuraea sp. H19]|uniref:VMAP-C domain-containing protein n=1 Tax=Nonomuraea sp. H19 TaxID=3452206 RepID=UPI003F8C58EF